MNITRTLRTGDLVACDRCKSLHRLVQGYHRHTRSAATGSFLVQCGGEMKVAALFGALSKGLALADISKGERYENPSRQGYTKDKSRGGGAS